MAILSCPKCAAIVVPEDSGGICPHCRAPISAPDDRTGLAGGADETREGPPSPAPPPASSGGGRASAPSTGWLSSSGAIDHGRFQPGALLGGRYRIVGRLGRGGMGEVYRADDLKLGQPVALKFLQPEVDRDPARLTQLHTEVRLARQVSHPNVCRVYDIDEIDGHSFLSMEYVDGEDLAALLRRIGRFPEDRALEIARQVCAGLAAAHERGVIHRDLKPANVMLDATGKVRITDFGLAGVSGEAIRAGTPAYMAPEQLAGGEVTARSDIYALGLVLYEIFTGQRALDGRNLAELIQKREQSGIVPPSALVRDLNPDVERTILRCLRPDPAERLPSALMVAASMPGGDPLAAILAAGETPSPELVAAAGGSETIPLWKAAIFAGWIIVALASLVLLYDRVMLINRVPMPKTPAALEDRAIEALNRLGYGETVGDAASGLGTSIGYAQFIASTSSAPDRFNTLAAERPTTLFFWYRTSPRPLVPFDSARAVGRADPPLSVGGMTVLSVDASGRLTEFIAVPLPTEDDEPERMVDWNVAFDLAGLPLTAFSRVAPRLVPPVFASDRFAWEGRVPEQPDHTFRVEAATHRGRPVYFVVTGPWTRFARAALVEPPLFNRIISMLAAFIMPALMIAAALLARRNLRLGRGDRVGALKAAGVIVVTSLAAWVLSGAHVGSVETDVQRFFGAVGRALFDAGLLWLAYLGLEPYVRRFSPDSLIGWTRLLAGRWQDPRVATDVVIGVSAGLGMTIFYGVHNILPPIAGRPEPMPMWIDPGILLGTGRVLSSILARINEAVTGSMIAVIGVLALTLLTRHRWLGALAAMVVFLPVVVQGMFPPGTPLLDLAVGFGIIAIFVVVIVRFGLLATIAALATHFILLRAPLTTDLASWRGSAALWYLGVMAAVGFGACYFARSGTAFRQPARAYYPETVKHGG